MIKVGAELAVRLMNLGSKDLQNTLCLSALFSEGNEDASSHHGHQLLSPNQEKKISLAPISAQTNPRRSQEFSRVLEASLCEHKRLQLLGF